MKHVNDDMDDLFRRASDRYPLRTDSADWDRLANALDHEPVPPFDKVEDKRRRRGLFWWFLLLPLAGLGWLIWHTNAPDAAQKGNVTAVQTAGAARQGTAVATRPTGVSAGTQDAGSVAVGGGAGTDGSVGAAGAAGSAGAAGDAGRVKSAGGGPGSAGDRRFARNVKAGQNNRLAVNRSGGDDAAVTTAGTKAAGSEEAAVTGSDGLTGSAGTGATSATTVTGSAARPLAPAALDLRRVPTAGDYDLVVNVKAPGHATDSLPRALKKATLPSKTSHGYIGVLGAPDFSTVKFQPMKGVGTTFGLLLGYSFNDRWAVESGIYLDRKRYYSDGEYFSTKNVHLYPGGNLLNVDGTCYMWEIPLNVRYNFTTSPRMKWFATAGLSTYLMTKEDYSYQYIPWPGGSTQESSWKINSPSQYWFSVVNLSAGFEQRVGKIGNLRLEPYVRLPLSGIGTGRLPIMSTGLNIGFTRQLW